MSGLSEFFNTKVYFSIVFLGKHNSSKTFFVTWLSKNCYLTILIISVIVSINRMILNALILIVHLLIYETSSLIS